MIEARHQINWALLVSQGRAKAHGIMWTEEEAIMLSTGKETVDSLRENHNIASLKKAVAKAPAKKASVAKKPVIEKKVEEKKE